ncbi:U3 small nucleolar RNA-associated protein 25 [Daldinia childiae]|uniref:U3 small nucleolar RNA-associated protein 25 n=1 Tax=Daldinia childiae TaxID=326645 RepID=UPI001445D655|nr:U3 small nucleolar RNA-associated protein 25 [Daldinia childiae]KAF3057984.1 U3 small nucleolar RNA-associated protein 25 [Daldinia childiae]
MREDEVSEEEEQLPSDDASENEGSGSEDEQEQATSRPYFALMQSLSKEPSAPSAKRRKLDTQSEEVKSSKLNQKEATTTEEDEERDVDHVEEAEEGPDNEIEMDDDDDEDVPDSSDPFETHFVNPDQNEVQKRIKAIQNNEYSQSHSEKNNWRLIRNFPGKDIAQPAALPPPIPGPSSLNLKHRLAETANRKRPTFDKLEQVLYPLTFAYNDILFCGRTARNAESLRRMACLHSVNHVFKTRDRVIKNNAKLAKDAENSDFEPRDQGFTRPESIDATSDTELGCQYEDRPEDFRELFEGNDDDMFRIGIKFTRKTIKYFAQFYNSDILIASPLGLRMAIGSEEDKKVDFDFLSSIEVVVVDQADALLMQNWEHVEYIFEHLNLQPREAHDCDFSRVREWYLDKQAQNFRQTLVLSAFNTPELVELHRRFGTNWTGRLRVQPEAYPGAIEELGVKAKQTFSRFEASSVAAEPDARFEYFTSAVIPALTKRAKSQDLSGTLIFVPSYLDFVRVRNYFATSPACAGLAFAAISEYAEVPEASRARSHFASGRHQVLLYTERAHHFRRYALRGVRRVIMYGLPDNPTFYKEIVGGYLGRSERELKLEPGRGTARVMFSRYDLLKLERVVGSKRVGRMIKEKGDTFDFV